MVLEWLPIRYAPPLTSLIPDGIQWHAHLRLGIELGLPSRARLHSDLVFGKVWVG